ncbi:hypothetical protein BU24DRAFT_37043 [Aaosphaeria arxii CBS 175.79]|uniref:Uncharacterized protein n=1 Tax=Aaosphaeria arxii CBS 175.79 TaxID=1450172 RepID=A0A6A5Y914_9PLEO|nr:uncharacterized protein BU24DRAFT_37043 [Aaosphaeria arxii CBS 175.79]KAF2022075.1 hypothetical protein BU24DRAFT_37043 [Aaosphaeria arxii CBS 175.79]
MTRHAPCEGWIARMFFFLASAVAIMVMTMVVMVKKHSTGCDYMPCHATHTPFPPSLHLHFLPLSTVGPADLRKCNPTNSISIIRSQVCHSKDPPPKRASGPILHESRL